MTLLNPGLELNLLLVLGLTNLITITLVWLSCRCRLGNGLFNRLMERGFYKKFYNLGHCYYWWLFIASVLLHATLAIDLFLIPL